MEEYRDLIGYEGSYQVSNLGNVRSLKFGKVKQMKLGLGTTGYCKVRLSLGGVCKTNEVHQLVAIAFLNHTPCGTETVIDHINHIRIDNRVENLRLVTHRFDSSHLKKKGTSQYTGVSWHKGNKKWQSQIVINGKLKYLGSFTDEIDAHLAYQKALTKL